MQTFQPRHVEAKVPAGQQASFDMQAFQIVGQCRDADIHLKVCCALTRSMQMPVLRVHGLLRANAYDCDCIQGSRRDCWRCTSSAASDMLLKLQLSLNLGACLARYFVREALTNARDGVG